MCFEQVSDNLFVCQEQLISKIFSPEINLLNLRKNKAIQHSFFVQLIFRREANKIFFGRIL